MDNFLTSSIHCVSFIRYWQNQQKCGLWNEVVDPLSLTSLYEGLQDTVYILLPSHWKNYCSPFCICCTPTLRLKTTARDPDVQWCRLLVLVLWFSLRKFCVCPEKVGIIVFFFVALICCITFEKKKQGYYNFSIF